jgi:hypothetical protein
VNIAVGCTISAGVLMFVAIAAVPWFRSVVGRLFIALGIGAAYALLGAFISHQH